MDDRVKTFIELRMRTLQGNLDALRSISAVTADNLVMQNVALGGLAELRRVEAFIDNLDKIDSFIMQALAINLDNLTITPCPKCGSTLPKFIGAKDITCLTCLNSWEIDYAETGI